MFGEREYNEVTKDDILSEVEEDEIFNFYIENLIINREMLSPLREENNESFIVGDHKEKLVFKDFGTGEYGDVFYFVQLKYEVNYYDALKIIANHMGVCSFPEFDDIEVAATGSVQRVTKGDTIIRISRRDWNKEDIDYWKSHGWNSALAKEYHLSPLQHYWINGYSFSCKKSNPAYCYDQGYHRYKIYQPFDERYRFINNCNGIIQGLEQLPKEGGNLLFITSSMKDIGCLRTIGNWSIAPSSENSFIGKNIVDELKENWNRVVLFLNGDEAGIESAKKQSVRYDIPYIYLDQEKDPSDFFRKLGESKLKKEIKTKLDEI